MLLAIIIQLFLHFADFHSKQAQTEEYGELAESFEVNNFHDNRGRGIGETDEILPSVYLTR
jgi:hypothetical protein